MTRVLCKELPWKEPSLWSNMMQRWRVERGKDGEERLRVERGRDGEERETVRERGEMTCERERGEIDGQAKRTDEEMREKMYVETGNQFW